MEHFNGEYLMQIHVGDFRSEGKQVWDLGSVTLEFNQGADSGNNLGVLDQYLPKALITHIFPEEEQPASMIVRVILCLLILNLVTINWSCCRLHCITVLY